MQVLDIGAGSLRFAKELRHLNPHLRLTVLCGEPSWRIPYSWGHVRKIIATYDDFKVEDKSLDLVTLNAYHPFQRPGDIEKELLRTLKPGGLFVSAHPVGYHPAIENTQVLAPVIFEGMREIRFVLEGSIRPRAMCRFVVKGSCEITYPASPTNLNRMLEVRMPDCLRVRESSYIYARSDKEPSICVWQRQ